jgi:hypothetical protein
MIGPANFPELVASRYRPIRLIAAGGMGAVYEVEHTLTGERLALKVLSWSANASPEALARFKREVRASAIIKSDNVVRVTDADVAPELGGAPFLVMELLEGTDLEQAAATAPPTPATVVEWLRQVARAIDKAHQLGIVHRDLKPENLFLATKSDATPLVKILDFGIVKLMEEGTGATGSGQILGTPKYMAFEQASANAQITPATDRCALGLIAYRLLMGESYYQGGVMSILGQLLHGQLQPPSERGSRFPRAFDAWFLKACHRDPEERFASASEQIEALATALGLPTAAIEALPKPSSRSGSRRAGRRARPVLLAAVSAAVVLVAAVIATRHAKTGGPDAPVVCGLPTQGATAACGTCLAQACCGEAQACSQSTGCPLVEGCVHDCPSGNAACRARCYAGKGPLADLQLALETCRATTCAAQCLPPPWACLGHVKWDSPGPIPRKLTIKTTTVCTNCGTGGFPIGGGPGGSQLAGATVRVCSLSDPKCALPLTTGKTDDSGEATLTIDTSLYRPPLSVFLEYRKQGYMDTLMHILPPLATDLDVGHVVLWDQKANLETTVANLGARYVPARANLGVSVNDCNGQPAIKKTALTWLDRDGATLTQDYFPFSASARALNFPVNAAGITRIVARVAETNQLIATANVVVRPNTCTGVTLTPAP